MKGVIIYSTKYGSTAEYANWVGEATDLPVFDLKHPLADPSQYDFLILGSAILFYKPTMRHWINSNLADINDKPVIFFSVSGAGPGPKLDGWLNNSLPKSFITRMTHVGLRGRMNPKDLNWGMRLIMKIGAWLNPDPQASKDEAYGFDYMDKASIAPIVELVDQYRSVPTPA